MIFRDNLMELSMAEKGEYVYQWPRPMVTVDMAVFAVAAGDSKVLLIERRDEPYRGKWALPGGFVEMDEELQTAAARELAEETGLVEVGLQQLHTFGTVGRDPRGRVITVVYWGIVEAGKMEVMAGDDAAQAKWFDIDELPQLAFDHDEVIKMAIEKLGTVKGADCEK